MKLSIIKLYTLLGTVFLFACQSASDKTAHAKLPRMDNEFSKVNLDFSDTTTLEAQKIIHSLDSFYAIQTRLGFNGSVLVGYEGKVLYKRHLGYANKSKNILLSPQSSSQLASTSKPFTATAILWLHQNKYLDINKPVKEYLPTFPYETITVKMLLNHRSGLPDYLKFAGKYWGHSTPRTNDDLLDLFARVKPALNSRVDARFEYCNSNYAILASILESVTKMPYPKFMKEFIFEPLGMKNTFVYDPNGYKPEKMAISYKANWTPEPDMFADGIYGDKNIYSTVEDLYRWDQSFYHNTLLNNATQDLAYTGCSFEKPGVKNYGLGWRMMTYPDGYKMVFHNGWWHGNNTIFYRFIKDNFTIIVLGNRFNNRIYQQGKAIYAIVQSQSANKMQWEESGSPRMD